MDPVCFILLMHQGKPDEALPLLGRAMKIRLKAFGGTHKDTVESQARLDEARLPQASEYAMRWLLVV